MLYGDRIYIESPTNGMIVNQNDDRNEEINQRLVRFQMSSSLVLDPVITGRPVTTRRDLFPCVERRRPVQEPIQTPVVPFQISSGFCAGNGGAPLSGFNVDIESTLQPRRGSNNDERREYIPDSSSDMYVAKKAFRLGRQKEKQPYYLNVSHSKCTHIPEFLNPDRRQVGYMPFHNDTRTQLRNL